MGFLCSSFVLQALQAANPWPLALLTLQVPFWGADRSTPGGAWMTLMPFFCVLEKMDLLDWLGRLWPFNGKFCCLSCPSSSMFSCHCLHCCISGSTVYLCVSWFLYLARLRITALSCRLDVCRMARLIKLQADEGQQFYRALNAYKTQSSRCSLLRLSDSFRVCFHCLFNLELDLLGFADPCAPFHCVIY